MDGFIRVFKKPVTSDDVEFIHANLLQGSQVSCSLAASNELRPDPQSGRQRGLPVRRETGLASGSGQEGG